MTAFGDLQPSPIFHTLSLINLGGRKYDHPASYVAAVPSSPWCVQFFLNYKPKMPFLLEVAFVCGVLS